MTYVSNLHQKCTSVTHVGDENDDKREHPLHKNLEYNLDFDDG